MRGRGGQGAERVSLRCTDRKGRIGDRAELARTMSNSLNSPIPVDPIRQVAPRVRLNDYHTAESIRPA